MNKKTVFELYSTGTKITFHSISKNIAEKLLMFAITHTVGDTIKINGVSYTFYHISLNGKWRSVSIYYTARNGIVRISDHWSGIKRSFPGKGAYRHLKSTGTIALNFYTLVGKDNSFSPNVKFNAKYVEHDYYDGDIIHNVIIQNHVFEGGFVNLRQINFNDERAKRRRTSNYKRC